MDALLGGACCPTTTHTASQAKPKSATKRNRLAGPNSTDSEGSASIAAAEPKYMPVARKKQAQIPVTRAYQVSAELKKRCRLDGIDQKAPRYPCT